MSIFDWKDSYGVGVPEIDAQHRRLYSLAAELYDAMNAGKGKTLVEPVLDSLIAYTRTHFQFEERMLEQTRYPDLRQHKVLHEELTAKVLQFQPDFKAGKAGLAVEIMPFLANWLRQHIGGTDRKYVPFVNAKNAG